MLGLLIIRQSPSHKPSSRLVSVSFMSRVRRATTSGDVISSSHVVTMSRNIDADFIVTYWNVKTSNKTWPLSAISSSRKLRGFVTDGGPFTAAIGHSPNTATLLLAARDIYIPGSKETLPERKRKPAATASLTPAASVRVIIRESSTFIHIHCSTALIGDCTALQPPLHSLTASCHPRPVGLYIAFRPTSKGAVSFHHLENRSGQVRQWHSLGVARMLSWVQIFVCGANSLFSHNGAGRWFTRDGKAESSAGAWRCSPATVRGLVAREVDWGMLSGVHFFPDKKLTTFFSRRLQKTFFWT